VTEYLGVPGTHGSRREDEWNHLGSPFTNYLLRRGFVSVEERAIVPFRWSTDYDSGRGGREDWIALGYALYYYHVPPLRPELSIPGARTRLICHSHAGNGAFYAASFGLKIDCLITVGTPVVGRMDSVVEAARPNIARWLHLYSKRDLVQLAGELWDGRWGFRRKFELADRNEEMPKGHGDVLRDKDLFPLWVDRGWLAYLRGDKNGDKA
jgi:hypothetical protein